MATFDYVLVKICINYIIYILQSYASNSWNWNSMRKGIFFVWKSTLLIYSESSSAANMYWCHDIRNKEATPLETKEKLSISEFSPETGRKVFEEYYFKCRLLAYYLEYQTLIRSESSWG